MDYEKAYKAVLKTATQWIKDGCTDKEKICLESVFPELRESEDERIRKQLIEYFEGFRMGNVEVRWEGLIVQEVLAWLEKQKEPEKEELVYRLNGLMQEYINEAKDQEEEEHRFKCYKLFWNALEDASYFEQKEQKPDTRDSDDLQLLGFIYDLLNEIEWNDNWAMSKDECLRRLNNYRPQKPAEWSKEDEEMMTEIIEFLEYAYPYDNEFRIAWLKSLRPSWKPFDDEERLINTSISFLKDFADKGYENAVECIDWLKSKLNGNTCK